MSARFIVDGNMVIKKDGVATDLTLAAFEESSDFDTDSVYTIDYAPTESEIRLKIIWRHYPFTSRSSIIHSAIIKKYGGDNS